MSSLVGALFCLLSSSAIVLSEEPQCSRFHYEEQTLLKLVKLELQMEQIQKELTNLKEKNEKQELDSVSTLKLIQDDVQNLLNTKKMSHYVRWGGKDCPGTGTSMLYKGYMAGNKWDNHGGGTNSLCLPEAPTWAEHIDGHHSGSLIYGTEVEIDGALSNKMFGSNVYNQDLSCAMCASTRASVVMFPGHSKCLDGWTTEYQGYLVASHPTWKGSSDFVCLDSNFVKGKNTGNNEHVVKPVEIKCGALPCPPYVEGREVACVVCSK